MVVGKVMRWSPWAPSPTKKKKRKLQVRLRVTRLEGLPAPPSSKGVAAVAVKWKAPPPSKAGGISSLLTGRRRKETAGNVSRETAVSVTGVAEFGDGKENEFWNACWFVDSGSDPDSVGVWEVSFSVLQGFRDEGEGRKERKLAEIGTKQVNLAEWASASQSQEEAERVVGKESQLQVQRKQLPITLVKDGSSADATLHVEVSFEEIRKSEATSAHQRAEKTRKEEVETSDDSIIFDPANLELLANEEEKLPEYRSRSTSADTSSSSSRGSSPELQFRSGSKRSFFSLKRSTKKMANKSKAEDEGETQENQPSSSSSTNKGSPEPGQDEDPIGSWESREFISRDRHTKLKAQTFFASVDQRDESVGGESACTALVALIANALHLKGTKTPTRSEFDALIREGSSEWRKLCDNASYIEHFPNKHFDLDTIIEANIRPISVVWEKSFVGFFQPESFESLRGAMSFGDIWKEITNDVGGDCRVYIVSWNDHFFVLKVESDAYCIIDTLGERLFEGCTKAYILRFDDSTEMHSLPENNENGDGEELVCSGKECCREFIKRFLAAIPLREELEVEEKGTGNANTALHQRLQIEFHLTEASNQTVIDDIESR